MKYLVTGSAGFIGFRLCQRLLESGHEVIGIDNMNAYYDQGLKQSRLHILEQYPQFRFIPLDITDREKVLVLCTQENFDRVIHLAAQAGVRYSLQNPFAYADSNLNGHLAILEGCRQAKVKHLVYASSSSVYGVTDKMPFTTDMPTDHPISLYAATKKANELMAHSYSHLYQLPTTGLRFFTVYGPWGRPDMALFKFTKAILAGEPIDVYNNGDLSRDFTFIDDIVEGVIRISDIIPQADPQNRSDSPAESSAPYRIYNIGNGQPVKLIEFISALEKALGKEAIKNFLPMQAGDVYTTWADTEDLFKATGYRPHVTIEQGVQAFVDWYKSYYKI
ncbi:NAD-dependent epimerase [Providencia rustigianii]|uniref:NAD dependent epimerase/dehydratase family protein n=2 Tax=Providencia rustigianii TaxID=158850 RepID=D1P7F4_9GAMM|nr:NAD-dependent epimerase [Providencia rustigianii]EFB70694.1 NAD dependent epimerase/dehydratase family protein [Providencia rustigianii DSM 4541]MTC59916.1 SDR family NAD(P)-dependent oxidoreductase [Providencia rustigianii]SUC29095.1 UDP-glucose 4-epimerase [Providencia rustigianii]SUC37342.1 UDP-glucose 4-epimerase [Providencia rustigianii]VEH57172.1 UDP-glucose 4-epimerase [Providencia rustigianii]